MRAQTTLEFVIILSAVASLSVFVIGAYFGLTNAQKPFYEKALNQTWTSNATYNPGGNAGSAEELYASIANLTYVNRSNSLEVIIASNMTVPKVYVVSAQDVAVTPEAYYNVSPDGISVLTFSVVPKAPGPVDLTAVADFAYANASSNADTYAAQPSASPVYQWNPEFSASLSSRNESVYYSIGPPKPVYTVSMWSHCSWETWWTDVQESITTQCGDANWYFWEFDPNCYWNHDIYFATYCVRLNPTNTSFSSIQDTQQYGYNATLVLYNGTMRLGASLNNLNGTSALTGSDGRVYGSANITGVSGAGPQAYSDYILMNTSGSERIVNMSYYETYSQYMNGLYSLMNYYNNTQGDSSSAAQEMSYFNSSSMDFINSPAAQEQYCGIMDSGGNVVYSCKPLSGLYYDINVSIDPLVFDSNQTLSVQGSTINLR
jgi:hypothetical protein